MSAVGTAVNARGKVVYLAAEVEASVLRNGKVGTRRGTDGCDGGNFGATPRELVVDITDARTLQPSFDEEGFELHQIAHDEIDFLKHADVVLKYYPVVADLVRKITGAKDVFCFDHNLRKSKSDEQIVGAAVTIQPPISLVHTDYTLTSAPARLDLLSQEPKTNDSWRAFLEEGASLVPPEIAERALAQGSRLQIINVWRSISKAGPVQCYPLAVVDSRSVELEDLVVFEVHYADRVGENYFVKHSERHKWCYYSAMQHDEALVIKQWDTEGRLAHQAAQAAGAPGAPLDPKRPLVSDFCIHAAFDSDPDGDKTNLPARESIETRVIVVY